MRNRFWLVAGAVVVLDQLTKLWAVQALSLSDPSRPLIPGLISLELVYNLGVAFGQLSGWGPVLVALSAAACAAMIYYRARVLRRAGTMHSLLSLGLALPLGGAVGNLLDRARLGHVVDFIVLEFWPQFPRFNIADSAITVGAVLLAAYFVFVVEAEPRPETEPAGAAPEAGSGQEA
ncbi:MAG: signal peptidase II [Armatimonadota bacterium]